MTSSHKSRFEVDFNLHQQHLKLKGLQPKTIQAYTRAMHRISEFFDLQVYDLSEHQLIDYFESLLRTHSWSTVKLDLYGLKFFYRHVLNREWTHVNLIKPPKASRLPDILSVQEAMTLFKNTHKLSYRVFFYTTYSMGLRLGEGLRLEVKDIDADRCRAHIRDAKGNKDRFVPLPSNTLSVLRRFWAIHRHPTLLFPNRKAGLKGCSSAPSPLDRGGVQASIRQVAKDCGFKKKLQRIPCDTVTQLT